MVKHLYDCVSHWYHGGQVYFYSDPHFSDEEMKYLRKNYIGDEEQVERINSKIGKHDTLVLLGDIGDETWLSRVRGYKVLLLGNHDKGVTNYVPYVNEIYEGPLVINEKIILSHEPVDLPFMFNIHGHDHSGWERLNHHLNVCAEHIDYTPVSFKKIIESGALKKVDSIHRITIDTATERKEKRLK